jgi:hypothetical protein
MFYNSEGEEIWTSRGRFHRDAHERIGSIAVQRFGAAIVRLLRLRRSS